MNNTIITKHAKKRIKERLGLSKRSHLRHIMKVLKEGIFLYRNKKNNTFFMQYHHSEYIFTLTYQLKPILITMYREEFN